jgi:hypothetical protein
MLMLQGQWVGRSHGTNTGHVVIELDDVGDHYEGRAYVFDDRPDLPSTIAVIELPKGTKEHTAPTIHLNPLEPFTLDLMSWQQFDARFPKITAPRTASAKWTLGENNIRIDWATPIGTQGHADLERVYGDKPSELVPIADVNSWEQFRRYIRDFEPYKFMYRGQESNKWRLRTAFHRTDRSDLLKFMQVDVAALHQHLSNLTAHFFQLTYPIENAAFISLAQHHGYPTPLLDWTYSPFIAAYFAFKRAAKPVEKVRIFLLDREQWRADFRQLEKVTPARPHFSILDAIALNNPRMIPQQALSTVTNVEDIETYVNERSKGTGRTYLRVIDLPIDDRKEALRELSMMGLTPGSLFPGLDGACNQLKDRFFGF